MIALDLRVLILRDLDGFRKQLQAYPEESLIWEPVDGVTNPPGNLALHVAGNLQAFIGAQLGGTGYQRDREAEFTVRGLPLVEVLAQLDAARAAVHATLPRLGAAELAAPYPLRFGDLQVGTGRFLAHLAGHLSYHLGQVDMHRRITTGGSALEGIQSLSALAD